MHSPTPWKAYGELIDTDTIDAGPIALVRNIDGTKATLDANAEFIVKAVNNHDALLEALKAEDAYQNSGLGRTTPPPDSVLPNTNHTCRWCQECVMRKDAMREAAIKAAQ